MASVPLYHGIVERAMLNFSTYWDNWSGTPVVGYYSVANPYQPLLTAWLPSNEFSFWYDVLRAEKPLTLFYDMTPIAGASYVGKITLGTSTEPLGEGPADVARRAPSGAPLHFCVSVTCRTTRSRLPPRNFLIRCSDQPRFSMASVSIGRSRMSRAPRQGRAAVEIDPSMTWSSPTSSSPARPPRAMRRA